MIKVVGRTFAAFILAAVLAGCASTKAPTASSVATFGSAVTATTSAYKTAFQNLAALDDYDDKLAVMVLATCRQGCPGITNIIPAKQSGMTAAQQKAVFDILQGLQSYADRLTALRSDNTLKLASTSAAGVAKNLNDLVAELTTDKFILFPAGMPATADTVNALADALGKIGDFIVGKVEDREIPPLIAKMDPYVQLVVAHMKDEIETLNTLNDQKLKRIGFDAGGLLANLRDGQRDKNVELYVEASAIYDEVVGKATAAHGLTAGISSALVKMTSAHMALKSPDAPDTWQQVVDFATLAQAVWNDAQKIAK